MLTIDKADNGYVLTLDDPEDEYDFMVREVYEFPEDPQSREYKDKLRELLYVILDHLGEYGSKHDKYAVTITVEVQN